MGCLKLHTDYESDLQVIHRKKGQKLLKNRGSYYPFGLKHKGYNNVINGTDHPYGFGRKEEQDELGLGWVDITARNYDPAIGRWMNLDPLAELMRRHSPYNFAFDNPVYFTDPDGMAPQGFGGVVNWGGQNEAWTIAEAEVDFKFDNKQKGCFDLVQLQLFPHVADFSQLFAHLLFDYVDRK